jgi:hypothetical protein
MVVLSILLRIDLRFPSLYQGCATLQPPRQEAPRRSSVRGTCTALEKEENRSTKDSVMGLASSNSLTLPFLVQVRPGGVRCHMQGAPRPQSALPRSSYSTVQECYISTCMAGWALYDYKGRLQVRDAMEKLQSLISQNSFERR